MVWKRNKVESMGKRVKYKATSKSNDKMDQMITSKLENGPEIGVRETNMNEL